MTARRIVVRGRVQGVGFRAALAVEASRLGLVGWVRNRADGTVEALAAGAADAVESLVRWAHDGPPAAQVAGVDVQPADPPGAEGFAVTG
jgi:acylphosphatase